MKKLQNRGVEALLQAINVIEQLDIDLPIKVFYANNKNRDKLEPAYKNIHKAKLKLLEKYGVEDKKSPLGFKLEKDNRTFAFKDAGSKKKFEEEITPIMDEEVTVDIHKLSIEEFSGIGLKKADFPMLDVYLEHIVSDEL